MQRLQLSDAAELDAAARREARRPGGGQEARVRRWVAERTIPLRLVEEVLLWEWVGGSDADPVDDIDEVVNGGKARDRPGSSSTRRSGRHPGCTATRATATRSSCCGEPHGGW